MYLVRFGGAGAVLPFLFVVRRICTFTLLPLVENVDNFDDDVPRSACKKSSNHFTSSGCDQLNERLLAIHSPDGTVLLSECVLI